MLHRVPQADYVGVAPRQDFELDPRVEFERVCPAHVKVLGGLDGYWCPYDDGHSAKPVTDDKAVLAVTVAWLVVAIENDRQRVAATVYGTGRVTWSLWFLNRYADAVAQLGGRDVNGFRDGFFASKLPGFKQRLQRLRATGMAYQEARAEAEHQALARLEAEMDRLEGERIPA